METSRSIAAIVVLAASFSGCLVLWPSRSLAVSFSGCAVADCLVPWLSHSHWCWPSASFNSDFLIVHHQSSLHIMVEAYTTGENRGPVVITLTRGEERVTVTLDDLEVCFVMFLIL